jgi:hypothetical protein
LTAEFNNRIAAQRKILQLVNCGSEYAEELFGLSQNAINRWVFKNHIKSESHLVSLINEASAKLFFLSNKSQEQISEEYKTISTEIEALYKLIEAEIG